MKTLIETLFGELWFDPSIIDLVLWFPHLSWRDFIVSAIAVLTWNWLCDGLWRLAAQWSKDRLLAFRPAAQRLHARSRLRSQRTSWRPPPWPATERNRDRQLLQFSVR